MKIKFLILFFAISFSGCQKKYDVEEYLEFVNNNSDYNKEVEAGQFIFKSSFKPNTYMSLVEIANSQDKNNQELKFEAEKKQFSNTLYFNLIIGAKDSSEILSMKELGLANYNKVQTFLSTYMDQSFFLLTSNSDTIKTFLYQYLKSNNYSPKLSFIITFPKSELTEKEGKYFDLVYNDKLFNLPEPVKFRFDADIINKKEPEIIF
jgi:hypothetical protein